MSKILLLIVSTFTFLAVSQATEQTLFSDEDIQTAEYILSISKKNHRCYSKDSTNKELFLGRKAHSKHWAKKNAMKACEKRSTVPESCYITKCKKKK